jgi:stage III sporulation protein AH
MKMNVIVGKRQIVLAALVLCLSLAVYLNWIYSGSELGLMTTGALEETRSYGDSQYVSIDTENADAYFAEAKISRQRTRDEAVTTLKTLIESDSITPDQRTELALKTSAMAEAVEKEGKIENLIKAKGFTECMVYYDTERVDVIVKTNGLLANEVAQMKDIIVREVSVDNENIAIIEIN